MLDVYWRNAGRWRLVAQDHDPQRAAEAVTAWQAVALDHVSSGVYHARQAFVLDTQLQALALEQTEVLSRTAELAQASEALQAWRNESQAWTSERPVEAGERDLLLAPVQAAGTNSAFQALAASLPAAGAPNSDYQAWLGQSFATLNSEAAQLQAQSQALEIRRIELAGLYTAAAEKSRGFSANLEVDPLSDAPPAITIIRPTAVMALIGAILGLSAWIILWLGRAALKARA
jgi:hypothetical protein